MNNVNSQIIQNIKLIADEKRIPDSIVAESLRDAITKAYVKEFPETELEVIIDLKDDLLEVNQLFKVVEDSPELNDYCEITLAEAKEKNPNAAIGENIKEYIDLAKLDRQVVAHILQIFKHNISNMANKQVYEDWKNRQNEVIYAEIEKVDSRSGFIIVNLENTFGFLGNNEKIPGEILVPGQKYNFFIKEVKEQTKGWPIILSRADVGLVKYLLNLQVPEIQEGIVEIKSIARVAGFKTKVALVSHQVGVEPVGTVIGSRGVRIKSVSEQIHNEKIEVIQFDEDLQKYLINVCSPAEIIGAKITEPEDELGRREIVIICRKDKLALLIGKKGSNVRLISQMLNANIEVKTAEEAAEENIEYAKIDMNTIRQRTFDRTFNRYRTDNDQFNSYNRTPGQGSNSYNRTPGQGTSSYNRTPGQGNNSYTRAPRDNNFQNSQQSSSSQPAKKNKFSILNDLNKEDLLKEISKSSFSSDIGDEMTSDDFGGNDYSKYDEE